MPVKKAYLTIDDVPSKDFRNKVKFFTVKSIPALFFCWGENMARYENDLVDAVQKGFILGNHSWSHPHFSDLTLEECQREIEATDIMIDKIYRKSGIARPAKFFRFPYFDNGGNPNLSSFEKGSSMLAKDGFRDSWDEKREAIQAYLKELGYTQPKFQGITLQWVREKKLLDGLDVRCTFDQMEYWLNKPNAPLGLNKAEAIMARIDEDSPEEGRALNDPRTTDIILIHDHEPAESIALFYKIIERYLDKGICFIKIHKE